ncbi:nucleotide-diphospho-sugar transferase [Phellopilus nigrolimitatus]|nr:nucleotide-diphospho-sugar transferase [Phellopilus nigrolimitatus]
MSEPEQRKAWVTLLTKPAYLSGTLVLSFSLKAVGSKYPLIVMTSPGLPKEVREVLELFGLETAPVDRLSAESAAIREARFTETWTKLAVFRLVQFSSVGVKMQRVVLLDSDMLVRKNMDELLDIPLEDGWIAADHACACNPLRFAHYPADWIPENCAYSSSEYPPEITPESPRPYTLLNSGAVVLNPSTETFATLERILAESPLVDTFQFADQDLFAEAFKGRWKPISYVYNALKTLRVVHKDLWRDEDVKCVHYILADKPWTYRPKKGEAPLNEFHDVNLWWWDAYYGIGEQLNKAGTEEHRRAWEYINANVAS